MADQNVAKGATNSSIGDPLILNALVEMLKNGQGQQITMMVHEAISKFIPAPITSVSTSSIMPVEPAMPSNTASVMPKNISRTAPTSIQTIGIEAHGMPSTSRTKTPITRVTSSAKSHSMPSTSNTDVPNIPVELEMHAPIRSTSNVGSVRILPPTSEQVSLRSNIDSQSRMLRLLPDTPENVQIRQEMIKQIQLWERALLETARPTSNEQEINEERIGPMQKCKSSSIIKDLFKGKKAIHHQIGSSGIAAKHIKRKGTSENNMLEVTHGQIWRINDPWAEFTMDSI